MADLTTLVPAGIYDSSTKAFDEILKENYTALNIQKALIYQIDNADSSILPWLANQFNVPAAAWQLADTDERKRNLLKNAILTKRKYGTPGAIEKILTALGFKHKLSEWYEYSGDPGYFKIDIDLIDRTYTEQVDTWLNELIEIVKRKSQKLTSFNLFLTNKSSIPVMSMATLSGETITVYPYNITELISSCKQYYIAGYQAVETITVYPISE